MGLSLSEAPFEHILGVGNASTLNTDGGWDHSGRFPCGFAPPGRLWEPLYGPKDCSRYPDGRLGEGPPYIASEQVLSWAQKEGWWAP